MSQFETLKRVVPEWFRAAEIALTVVSGSVADERVFSAMNFIKSDVRHRLDANLEACVQVYTQDLFTLSTFPFEKLRFGATDE